MTPGHTGVQARVQVPEDALVGDFVFLDSANEHSGFYDNNNGLDYHVPVSGASGTLPPLRIAHISVEMAPIAKVGGMGDVVTALGRAVQEYGHEVEVRAACCGVHACVMGRGAPSGGARRGLATRGHRLVVRL